MLVTNLFAQDSYQEVDSKSYQLYTEKNWQELSQYGKAASEKGYDYYYLNVRIGIAFFELKDFENAKSYFEKALQNSSASTYAKEYLFWSYYNLEEEIEAQKIYQSLPDSIQKRMDYHPSRIIDYIYVEGGMKKSNNKVAADNLFYGRVGFKHQFLPRFHIYHEYSYMEQKAIWGEMKQHQYLFIPSINLGKKWNISVAFNGSNYKSQLNYIDSTKKQGSHYQYSSGGSNYVVDTVITSHYLFRGGYEQNSVLAQLNINKRIRDWSFTSHFNIYQAFENPNYTRIVDYSYNIREVVMPFSPPTFSQQSNSDTMLFNKNNIYRQLQYGLDFNIKPIKNIILGADINYIYHSDFSKLNIIPYIRLYIGNSFSLFAYYVQKGNYVLSLFEGTQFLNSFDELKHKVNLTGMVRISSKVELYTTFQNGKIIDNLSLREYQLNSLFIGVKFRP
ncbi:MAG: hypothetical protein P1U44_11180 [Vicingaceae bacterium]|nr:hypothetical protein [Vicingaceae bacterium]